MTERLLGGGQGEETNEHVRSHKTQAGIAPSRRKGRPDFDLGGKKTSGNKRASGGGKTTVNRESKGRGLETRRGGNIASYEEERGEKTPPFTSEGNLTYNKREEKLNDVVGGGLPRKELTPASEKRKLPVLRRGGGAS